MKRILIALSVPVIALLVIGAVVQAQSTVTYSASVWLWTNEKIIVTANWVNNWYITQIRMHLELYDSTTQTMYTLDTIPGQECGINGNNAICSIDIDFMHHDWYLITYPAMDNPSGIYVHRNDGQPPPVDAYLFAVAPEPIRGDFRLKTYLPAIANRTGQQPDPWPYP